MDLSVAMGIPPKLRKKAGLDTFVSESYTVYAVPFIPAQTTLVGEASSYSNASGLIKLRTLITHGLATAAIAEQENASTILAAQSIESCVATDVYFAETSNYTLVSKAASPLRSPFRSSKRQETGAQTSRNAPHVSALGSRKPTNEEHRALLLVRPLTEANWADGSVQCLNPVVPKFPQTNPKADGFPALKKSFGRKRLPFCSISGPR